MRERVAALIERDGRLLVMRQRARGVTGRHDGPLYRTPPGGGVEPGESGIAAVVREVHEETGLIVSSAEFVSRIEYPAGVTTLYRVTVEPGEPVLGSDPDVACACPRLVGIEWCIAPPETVWTGPDAAKSLKVLVVE